MASKDWTYIRIRPKVKEALKEKVQKKNETYNDILERMLKGVRKNA